MAFICHGGWIPISAKILIGRRVTGSLGIKDDLENAGAIWVNEPVVVDGNLISSRTPRDLAPFGHAMVKFPRCQRAMNELGKLLVITGLAIAAMGALLWSGLGCGWLGRLPGDINYSKDNFSFHFPIVTCLLVSAALTLLMWLFRK